LDGRGIIRFVRTRLQYGTDGLEVDLPASNLTVLEPRFVPGLPDEAAAFREAVTRPLAGPPLRDLVRSTDRVAVVIPDLTRPLPTDRLLPWLFADLDHVPPERFVIVNGTGSHRANTEDELRRMVGADVKRRYRVVNHDAHDAKTLAPAGVGSDGQRVLLNRDDVEADRRIVLGFVEPHFMAGFSGGYRGIFPAVADIAAIMRYHDAKTIGHPMYDQWEAQLLALIRLKARVGLFSEIPAEEVRRAHLEPVADLRAALEAELSRVGRDTPVAVLPEGPMTIPYLS
jgi:nickel-dependent lactate racemase